MKYQDDVRYRSLIETFKALGLNGHPLFYEKLAEMACTHADKNKDYAGSRGALSNLHACERFGIDPVVGTVIRIMDKDSRFDTWFERYLQTPDPRMAVKDESIHDTLLDRAVYSILLSILIEETQHPLVTCSADGTPVNVSVGPIFRAPEGLTDEVKEQWQRETLELLHKALLGVVQR